MKKVVLVDTMVWTFMLNKNRYFGNAEEIFDNLLKEGFRFALNSVIKHEILRGRTKEFQAYFQRVIDWADNIGVDDEVFLKAIEIFKIQQIMSKRFERMPGKYLGDVLIAATAFLKECYLLTANLRDFAMPLFVIKDSYVLMKKGKGEFRNNLAQLETLYLLEPNYNFIELALKRLT